MDCVLFSIFLLSLVETVYGDCYTYYDGYSDVYYCYYGYGTQKSDGIALIAASCIGSVVVLGMFITFILVCCKVFCCSYSSHHGSVVYPYIPSQSSNYTQMTNQVPNLSPTTAMNNRPIQHLPQRAGVPQSVSQVNPLDVPEQASQHQANVPQQIVMVPQQQGFVYVRGEKCILSNFYPCDITDENKAVFRSAEHLYQFQKASFFNREELALDIKNAVDAHEAKRLSKSIGRSHLSNLWYQMKLGIMKKILLLKFNQVVDFRHALHESIGQIIVHNVSHTFWGKRKNGQGKNHFGHLLMNIRDEKLQKL